MKIKVSELKSICSEILNKLEKNKLKELDIDVDYYWNVDSESLCDLRIKNPGLTVGSITDDWNNLKKIIEEKTMPTIVDIERLANILKIITNTISKSDQVY